LHLSKEKYITSSPDAIVEKNNVFYSSVILGVLGGFKTKNFQKGMALQICNVGEFLDNG